jgi:hypothetical protein
MDWATFWAIFSQTHLVTLRILLAMFFHGCDPFIVKLDQHIQL